MTKEEIIQAISDDKMMPFIQPEQLAQIVAFVINNYKPSLPSNLDEAAEELSVEYRKRREECGLKDPIALNEVEEANYLGVLAGAEWQKEQMMKEAEECFVEWYDGLYLNLTTEQMSNAIERAGAKVGNKVKVNVIKED